jgi:thioredoxin-related protein
MKHKRPWACWILLVVAHLALPQAVLAADETRDPREFFFTQSFGDLPEELETARQEGKLGMLLFFEAEGCSYCEYMLQNVLNRPTVQDWYRQRFVSIAVDIHGDVELTDFDNITLPSKVFSDHRKVFVTPVVAFIDLEGDEIYRHTGMVRTVDEFMLIGRYIEGEHYFDTEFDRFAREQGEPPGDAPFSPADATDHRLDDRGSSK